MQAHRGLGTPLGLDRRKHLHPLWGARAGVPRGKADLPTSLLAALLRMVLTLGRVLEAHVQCLRQLK